MVRGIILVLFLTAVLAILFATPFVAPYSGTVYAAYQWLYSSVAWLDRFIDTTALIACVSLVLSVTLTIATIKFYLWGTRLFA